MESIENKILKSLKKCGRGTVFFADRFPLERIAEAYEIFEQKRDGVIKVAIIN